MKIGIDAHVLGKNLGGVERFIAELVKTLPIESAQHTFVVFVTKSFYKQVEHLSSRQVRYVPLAFSNPLIERLVLLPWLVVRHRLDALVIQRLAPWFCGKCRLIVTVHDLTPIKFSREYKGISNQLVRLLTKNSIARAHLILTPTRAIKTEIEHYCPMVKAPIVPFYNGVDTEKFKNHSTLVMNQTAFITPFIFTVGAIERRKNVETIIDMMAKIADENLELVIVGGIRDQVYFDELNTRIEKLALKNRVHYLGYMTETQLIAHYQSALMFITASRDEGFNIPPLESMACGVPVICSNIPVHHELFEGAALFFETMSVDDLFKQVQFVMQEPASMQTLIAQAHLKVAHFNWQQTGKNVANALELLS